MESKYRVRLFNAAGGLIGTWDTDEYDILTCGFQFLDKKTQKTVTISGTVIIDKP